MSVHIKVVGSLSVDALRCGRFAPLLRAYLGKLGTGHSTRFRVIGNLKVNALRLTAFAQGSIRLAIEVACHERALLRESNGGGGSRTPVRGFAFIDIYNV